MKKPIWLDVPEDHDYPAAESYLNLILDPTVAAMQVAKLRDAPVSQFKAKDIVRAAQLTMLTDENKHVARNLSKIEAGKPLSPVLLMRGSNMRLIIADGYHRSCAVYLNDEDAVVPCKIV